MYFFSFLQDFVMGLSILLRGTVEEKLNWAFNLYDINKDGYITKEVERLFQSMEAECSGHQLHTPGFCVFVPQLQVRSDQRNFITPSGCIGSKVTFGPELLPGSLV